MDRQDEQDKEDETLLHRKGTRSMIGWAFEDIHAPGSGFFGVLVQQWARVKLKRLKPPPNPSCPSMQIDLFALEAETKRREWKGVTSCPSWITPFLLSFSVVSDNCRAARTNSDYPGVSSVRSHSPSLRKGVAVGRIGGSPAADQAATSSLWPSRGTLRTRPMPSQKKKCSTPAP